MGRRSDPQESGGGGPPVHGGRAARFRHCLKGPDKGGGGSRLGQLRTMRRRPRLLPGNDRRRTPEPCQAQPICAVCCGFGRGSTPFSPAAAMTATARLFLCALCHCQVVLCRRCDHGNIYCSPGCGAEARRRSLRRAGRRYQDSRRGRHKHAERQRRYRERCRLRELENRGGGQKVTHHPLTPAADRPVVRRRPAVRAGTRPFGPERPSRVFRCHRCGRFCGQKVHPGLRPARWRAWEG